MAAAVVALRVKEEARHDQQPPPLGLQKELSLVDVSGQGAPEQQTAPGLRIGDTQIRNAVQAPAEQLQLAAVVGHQPRQVPLEVPPLDILVEHILPQAADGGLVHDDEPAQGVNQVRGPHDIARLDAVGEGEGKGVQVDHRAVAVQGVQAGQAAALVAEVPLGVLLDDGDAVLPGQLQQPPPLGQGHDDPGGVVVVWHGVDEFGRVFPDGGLQPGQVHAVLLHGHGDQLDALVAEDAGVVGDDGLLRDDAVPLLEVEGHQVVESLVGLGDQLDVLGVDIHVLLEQQGADVPLHPLGLIPGGVGQVEHDLLDALLRIGGLVHHDPAQGEEPLVLRLAEDVQEELLLLVEVVADHFLQGEEALEGEAPAGDLLDEIAPGLFGGDDQIPVIHQLTIGLDDGVPVHPQLLGQPALRRHFVAPAELAGQDQVLNGARDLEIKRGLAAAVDLDVHIPPFLRRKCL